MKNKKGEEVLDELESNAFVNRVANGLLELMHKEVMQIVEHQRWLVLSRIVNRIFMHHFKLAITASENAIHKRSTP